MTDRKGTRIHSPVFVFWRDSLVYWSQRDRALCRVSSSGERHWIPVTDKAMAATWSCRLEATPEGVILNGGTPDTPVSPIRIDLTTGAASSIRGVLEVQSDESFAKTAQLTKRGNIEVLTGRTKKVLARSGPVAGLWDYDPKEETVCFCDGSRVTVAGPGGKTSWRINRLVTVWSVSLQPDARQVWVSVERPFSLGSYLTVYSYDDTYLGRALNSEYPIGPPIRIVRAKDIALLKRAGSH